MYSVKKQAGQWVVVDSNGTVQFRSLRRKNCNDWVTNNTR